MADITYIYHIIFALLPSVIWLTFYLLKDKNPEPKGMIVKVFFWGMAFAVVVASFEILVLRFIKFAYPELNQEGIWFLVFKLFIIVALVEELAKYLIVRYSALFSSAVDEPLDIMLYFVVCALGFAAIENLLIMTLAIESFSFIVGLEFSFLRFIGATLLHTLASGVFGFFVAMSFYYKKNRKKLFFVGFLLAVLVHGFYNLAIVNLSDFAQIMAPAAILIALIIFTSIAFMKLRKLKGVCRN